MVRRTISLRIFRSAMKFTTSTMVRQFWQTNFRTKLGDKPAAKRLARYVATMSGDKAARPAASDLIGLAVPQQLG